MPQIRLNICNIRSLIEHDSTAVLARALKARYRPFLVGRSTKPTNLYLKLAFGTTNTEPARPKFDTPQIRYLKRAWSIDGAQFRCRLVPENGHLKAEGYSRANLYSVDSLLRVLWTQLLLRERGFLVHACGIRHGNRGFLFPGRSGRGKTTLARKTPLAAVLSDELVGVNLRNDTPLVMGTPFWGEFQRGGRPNNLPLRGIYFLQRGPALQLQPLAPPEALKKLLQCTLFFNTDAESTRQLLQWASQCVARVPAYRIQLTKQNTYQEIIRAISNHHDATK